MKPEDLDADLMKQTYDDLHQATAKGWGSGWNKFGDDLEKDNTVLTMQKNIFQFSGAKTYAQLKEFNSYLYKEGKIRSYADFKKEVLKVNTKYNRNYLQAEFQTARQAGHHGRNWHAFQKDKDLFPNLEYRTTADERVREEHQGLHGAIKPIDDPFWDTYYPPNGWRCRCYVVQTIKEATSETPEDENIKPEFRVNVAKEKQVFSKKHPYNKEMPVEVQKKLKKLSNERVFKIDQEVKTIKDVDRLFKRFSSHFPNYFKQGYSKLIPTAKRGLNGFTDMNGTIALKKGRLTSMKTGLNNIFKGKKTTRNQEDAFSTLWHEITHNRHKLKGGSIPYMTRKETLFMELANEYVSRKTLDVFMENLGGKLQHLEFKSNRESTGYNQMVNNLQRTLLYFQLNSKKTLLQIQKNLFNESYKDQNKHFVEFLKTNVKKKWKNKNYNASMLMEKIISLNESQFIDYLKTLEKINKND